MNRRIEKTRRSHHLWALLICLMSTSLVHAQDKPTRLTFDVASIKPSKSPTRDGGIKASPGGEGYIAQNIPVKLMISLMYKVPMRQIKGGPDWLNSDRYDVEAKADHSYNLDDLHIMYQNLLADRFNLKFHKETKEGPVYALTVDTPGSKMKVNDSAQDFRIPMNFSEDGTAVGKRVPMSYLCWWLGLQLQADERPVIDKTGLDKNYDFTLLFAPQRPPGSSSESSAYQDRLSIFDALKQQLGLKLHAEKGPVEYLVIDHIDRPSEN
jgi:uncharacterized protein (TIGR03435 family)